MKYLIAGLGNIGEEYENTRHNIGFMILDQWAITDSFSFNLDRHAHIAEISLRGKKVLLLKPTTYMNLSGKAIKYWMDKENIPVQNILVLVDDLALPFATLRLRLKGGDAGHNGLTSIQESLQTKEYARLRFGIGNNYPKGRQVDYVLGKFSNEEKKELPLLLNNSVDIVKSFVSIGSQLTMTKYN